MCVLEERDDEPEGWATFTEAPIGSSWSCEFVACIKDVDVPECFRCILPLNDWCKLFSWFCWSVGSTAKADEELFTRANCWGYVGCSYGGWKVCWRLGDDPLEELEPEPSPPMASGCNIPRDPLLTASWALGPRWSTGFEGGFGSGFLLVVRLGRIQLKQGIVVNTNTEIMQRFWNWHRKN